MLASSNATVAAKKFRFSGSFCEFFALYDMIWALWVETEKIKIFGMFTSNLEKKDKKLVNRKQKFEIKLWFQGKRIMKWH